MEQLKATVEHECFETPVRPSNGYALLHGQSDSNPSRCRPAVETQNVENNFGAYALYAALAFLPAVFGFPAARFAAQYAFILSPCFLL